MSEKPSILIVPGGFSLPEGYDSIVTHLTTAGYPTRCLALPTIGYEQASPQTMFDDAAHIAREAGQLADQGKDVVLLAHSYGGMPATQSTKGLDKATRQQAGKPGGIVLLAYVSAMVLPLGESDPTVVMTDDMLPNAHILEIREEDGWLYQGDPAEAAAVCFSDLPREEGEAYARKATRMSALAMPSALSHAGYLNIPAAYLVTEDDLCLQPAIQRAMLKAMQKASDKEIKVATVKSGHCPFLSRPDEVLGWLAGLLG